MNEPIFWIIMIIVALVWLCRRSPLFTFFLLGFIRGLMGRRW